MKRHGNLWDKFISMENIELAYKNSKKGKANYKQIQKIEKNPYFYLKQIQEMLISGEYKHSEYKEKYITTERKPRIVHAVQFFPDRIIHHMLHQIINPIFEPTFISDTYQCIKGRGIHKAVNKAKMVIFKEKPSFILKADIKKFYPSVDNEILKKKIQRKIKDKRLLDVIFKIIDSFEGIPIGNYVSQLFGNLYLNEIDHFVKSKTKLYIRYADDFVVFGKTKKELQLILNEVNDLLKNDKLILKNSTKIFPFPKNYLDFIGFRFYGNYFRPRKDILFKMFKLNKIKKKQIKDEKIASYFGWVKHSDSKILLYKLLINNNTDYVFKHLFKETKNDTKN